MKVHIASNSLLHERTNILKLTTFPLWKDTTKVDFLTGNMKIGKQLGYIFMKANFVSMLQLEGELWFCKYFLGFFP